MSAYAFPPAVEALITQFAKLPGVGRKSAVRLAFCVLGWPDGQAEAFAGAVLDAKHGIGLCPVCHNLTDQSPCALCAEERRDHALICVVAEPRDVAAIERTREFTGVYHVLHGVISPSAAKSPDELTISDLIRRVDAGGVREVILATNPDTEGDTTALYIARLLRPFGVTVTRLAYGMPIGGHLEFTDEITLLRALEGRRTI